MTADGLCDELGIHRSTLSSYIRKGLPRDDSVRPHRYDADECRAWIASNIRRRGGDQHGGLDDSADEVGDVQELYRRERALKTQAERELRELKLAEERGELVRASVVAARDARALLAFRAAVMQVAAEVTPKVLAAQSPVEVEGVIRDACRKTLETLSELEVK